MQENIITSQIKHSIAIYGSHDANVCVRTGPNEYRIYELERLTGKRYYSLSNDPDKTNVLRKMRDFLRSEHGIKEYDCIYWEGCTDETIDAIRKIFNPQFLQKCNHHEGHARGALWQSPFIYSLIISFDGGGMDNEEVSFFNIYKGSKPTNSIEKLATIPLDICSAYTMIAWPLAAIRKTGMDSYLSWAGKIMGLVAYGTVKSEWIDKFEKFYKGKINHGTLIDLFRSIHLNEGMNQVTDFQCQADIAATSQYVFEKIFIDTVEPFLKDEETGNLIITGGGALNVLLNQTLCRCLDAPCVIGDKNKDLFIPINPNDCGLSLGFLLKDLPPDSGKMDPITYNGFPLLDAMPEGGTECSLEELAALLTSGHIIGFVQGNSEVGPRALGNRSLLAHPAFDGMKDRLNEIKDRETFRPVSPVCRLEDADTYFGPPFESQFMSYSQFISSYGCMYIDECAHVDGTARLQTVTREQNETLYELLTRIDMLGEAPVLINTSFNVKGKPILTTHAEALQCLRETDIYGVWINGYLFTK